ncbi:M20/M25/M40 family metallo-hydrolase [Ornithinibacillus halotolerans]|uniref:Peptidase M20 n=1 Tax=Ornithinibacillus halotolerans TaxID=1274357 RepID=A0A916W970_9BACI|nr:M20/M25/M40 family metallo-hydrolase [Ornithinibacillus halotolerans]GGA77385.1 peptidase M20 [Ornithinibacillus halotolerans]
MLNSREAVLNLTKQLVSIRSVVNTEGESVIAHSLYTMISSYPYFQTNPGQVVIEKTLDDEKERYNVLAYVKGTKGKSNRTAIIMGHMDTVGVDDFNQLEEYAFMPDEWMNLLEEQELPDAVRNQLTPGEWLFGRGALDMKSGIASNLFLLQYFSEHPEQLNGNLVFIAECDEEDGSHGILSALTTLERWKNELQFEYVAAINADFVAPLYEGDPNRYVYKGTVGKLLPSFYIAGAETHVGSPFEGLDPNYIAAELVKQINYNPALCDVAHGEYTLPPVALKQMDLKTEYTVQTALGAYVYFNFFIHSWSPKEALHLLKEQADIAFNQAIESFEKNYQAYCQLTGEKYNGIPWQTRVLTFEEMDKLLRKAHGDKYVNGMEKFKEDLLHDESLDIRMYALRVVEEAWKWMENKTPTIILFYSSLYYPRIELSGESEKEARLNQAVDEAVNNIQAKYSKPIKVKNFFPFISDMSFLSLSDDEAGIQAVRENNPAWGKKHYVDYEKIRKMNIPVINIGPYGMDAHKKLERVEIDYSMEVVPNLTKLVIEKVLND